MTGIWKDSEGRVWFGCSLIQDEKTKGCAQEPSAMSELAGWIDENNETYRCNCAVLEEKAPKKLSWIQKIRGYDKDIDVLERQVKAFSELAETNKRNADRLQSLLTEALRDRDLNARVADLWQEKLIKANERIAELENDRTSASE